jgi:hypothetical protein
LSFSQAGTLKVTEEHPFLINDVWIPASQLQAGDELTTIDGKKVRITSIQDVETKEPFPVYNLEAGKYHDFVVDGGDGLGVVVHNSDLLPEMPRRTYDVQQARDMYQYYQTKGIDLDNIGFAVRNLDGRAGGRSYTRVLLSPHDIFLESVEEVPSAFHRPFYSFAKGIVQEEVIMWGTANQRYRALITYSQSVRDLPIHQRINSVYAELQKNIGTDMDCKFLALRKTLETGGGVCRHKASLLNQMLRSAGVPSKEVSSFGHVWVRVTDPHLGQFDLDPTWYIGPVRLPPRARLDTSNPFTYPSWEAEFLKLNTPSFTTP